MAEVYVLKSIESGKYYIGSTVDLKSRLKHHLGGHTPSTKRLRRLKLVFHQEFVSLNEARKIEKKLKKFKRHDFIDKIVNDGFIKIRP